MKETPRHFSPIKRTPRHFSLVETNDQNYSFPFFLVDCEFAYVREEDYHRKSPLDPPLHLPMNCSKTNLQLRNQCTLNLLILIRKKHPNLLPHIACNKVLTKIVFSFHFCILCTKWFGRLEI